MLFEDLLHHQLRMANREPKKSHVDLAREQRIDLPRRRHVSNLHFDTRMRIAKFAQCRRNQAMHSGDAYGNSQLSRFAVARWMKLSPSHARFAVDRGLSGVKQRIKIADDAATFSVKKLSSGCEVNVAAVAH